MTLKDGKPCTKCGTSSWYDWGNCKKCAYLRTKKWREDNPGKRSESDRKRYHANPEKYRKQQRELYQKNRESRLKQGAEWREKNPDYFKNYWQENKETVYAKSREWIENNREKDRAYKRKWKKKNPGNAIEYKHRRRARKNKAGGSFTMDEWETLCDKYGNVCLCCKKKKKLTIDHIVPIASGGSSDISNLQPLCRKCNSRKNNRTIDYR